MAETDRMQTLQQMLAKDPNDTFLLYAIALEHKKIADYGCEIDRVVNHGIAFGCYFRDPEDNRVEVYWSTGMDYPQPHGEPIDLDLSTPELVLIIENMAPKEGSGPKYYGRDAGKRLLS